VPARLGGVAAAVHRAPLAPAGRRAVVEARRAGVRGADAHAPRLLGAAEHRGRVQRDHAERAARRVGRLALAERGPAVGPDGEVRARARVHEPLVDVRDRRGGRGLAGHPGLHGGVDRLAQRPRLVEDGAGHAPLALEQPGAGEPQREVGRGAQALDAPAPALPDGVDEVEGGATAEPVKVRNHF
jgi:hypothetical protein